MNTTFEPGAVFRKTASEGGTVGRHTNTHTQIQNQKSLYGAGTKGLFAQWPSALQWGLAGMRSPEQGHKHQTFKPSTEGGGRNTCQAVSPQYGYVG